MGAEDQNPNPAIDGIQAIDDDALDAATGGITLCSNPSTCSTQPGSGSGYSVNQTIYYQTSISSTVN
ncbi:MAG TPA: hypothetical protein DCQ04_11185 [Actinobacteria bacterium]|jgi:hypothetical protein|nr:hypothetical protein [Actinomycetota bacterium]